MPKWPENNSGVIIQVSRLDTFAAGQDGSSLSWLSPQEQLRLASINAAKRKQQYLAGHLLIRQLASGHFGGQLRDWRYAIRQTEHILLSSDSRQQSLHVSISHSGDWLAVAIAPFAIGIDIETYTKIRDFRSIASHVFSRDEVASLRGCEGDELVRKFYLCWTLKESLAKQFGEGLKPEQSHLSTAVGVEDGQDAILQSWASRDYVVSLASKAQTNIKIVGIPDNAEHRFWQAVPAN